jgi:adenylate cyclase
MSPCLSVKKGRQIGAAAMGPPRSQVITAIGDAVNTCARLKSLTKEYQCAVVISCQAAEAAGLTLGGQQSHEALVKG